MFKFFYNPKTQYILRQLGWVPVFAFFVDHVYSVASVNGRSMQPTFNPDSNRLRHDIVLLNRWAIARRKYEIGDVVTLWSPFDPDLLITKRIIALEGDTVKTLSSYPEKYVIVPKGYCWVEGDENFHSKDSNSFGPVPLGLINAKVTHIIWPLSRLGKVPIKTCPERVSNFRTIEGYGPNYGSGYGTPKRDMQSQGGGWISPSEGSSFFSSDSPKNQSSSVKETRQTLRPVTIKQILSIEPKEPLQLDGHDISSVTFVATVRSVNEQTNYINYIMEDGTGSIEVKSFFNDDSNEKKFETRANTYVRVLGIVKLSQRIVVNPFSIRLINDYNEISYHFLEVIQNSTAFQYENNTFISSGGGGNNDQFNRFKNEPDDLYPTNFTDIDKAIMRYVEEFKGNDREIKVQDIINKFSIYGQSTVRDSIEMLKNEGHLFTTSDELHVKSTSDFC
ncbi:5536_t:CDS:2 [Ambispora leptoticha]|uniref:Mitochondrial inner membrane protease subunit 2 n=1 Tax=Ambispora leptoticha TaxID=144679 RepID=A0A9N9GJ56_9GLOM|nr:5536_t:CDS:2 [Ambispora leptoticha]